MVTAVFVLIVAAFALNSLIRHFGTDFWRGPGRVARDLRTASFTRRPEEPEAGDADEALDAVADEQAGALAGGRPVEAREWRPLPPEEAREPMAPRRSPEQRPGVVPGREPVTEEFARIAEAPLAEDRTEVIRRLPRG